MDHKQAAELGAFIKRARTNKGLSGRQLAKQIEVSDTTIMRIEHGDILTPHADTLGRIAEALDLSTLNLLQKAGYSRTDDLPAIPLYLRSKYSDLPPEAVEKIEKHARRIAKQHGISLEGPAPGQDET